ncbi:response regulator [Motiliproteus sp. MSK22-1]|uniref:response regulator n=1 Tax=Motiliproteus sp. MSK22-1 TaxID=1897630 RepID=UPI0009781685|nr:response regulator [Motiliproteus sp. MSK22-1]OMH34798.1 hypothetical protein BGP75_10865 [Motiliproteus sp. MSK22-1]
MRISELYVMIVEPSKVQRRIIENHLNSVGISSIVGCSTGEEALQGAREDTPDLLISALYLQDMSGADLLSQLRGDSLLKDVAFVLISSETQFRYLDPVKQAGATAVLPKPFTEEQLNTALKTTVHNIEPEGMALQEQDLELLNVLLVDDSPLARKFIRKVLTGLGIRNFVEACDGQDALEKMKDNFFDLVVTDYNMPNLNGKELTEQIRKRSTQQSVPILMVTSEENQGRLSGVQQAGVSAMCDKPFAAEDVRQLLASLLPDS